MSTFDRSGLADHELLEGCREHLADEAKQLAAVLADLAEIGMRKLYRPAAYPSLTEFCVHELGMSEDAAAKRCFAARACARFPVLLVAVAKRRLSLTGVVLLAPHLTPENIAELAPAAEHRTCAEIRTLLAARFPRPNVRTQIVRVPATTCEPESDSNPIPVTSPEQSPALVLENAPAARTRIAPLSPGRFELRGTMTQEMADDLKAVQNLLGHGECGGDAMNVLARAVKLLRTQLEKKRCAATDRPRKRRASGDTRYVPAAVERAVRERDGNQCTFKSESGKRCAARSHLQLDHVVPVARGGRSTVENLRLLCAAHNQLEAERTLGAGYMAEKREGAKAARAEARKQLEADLVSGLRSLRFTAAEAKEAARRCMEALPNAPLEQLVRHALKGLAPKCTRTAADELRGATA